MSFLNDEIHTLGSWPSPGLLKSAWLNRVHIPNFRRLLPKMVMGIMKKKGGGREMKPKNVIGKGCSPFWVTFSFFATKNVLRHLNFFQNKG